MSVAFLYFVKYLSVLGSTGFSLGHQNFGDDLKNYLKVELQMSKLKLCMFTLHFLFHIGKPVQFAKDR